MWHRRTIGLCSFSHSPSFWTLGLSSRGWSLEASKPPRCGRFPRSVDGEGGMGKGVPWRVDHHQDFHIHQKSELLRHAGYVFNHVSGSEHYSHILSLVTHTHTKFFFTKVFFTVALLLKPVSDARFLHTQTQNKDLLRSSIFCRCLCYFKIRLYCEGRCKIRST